MTVINKSHGHQFWCSVFSQCGMNEPASGTKSTFKPPPRQHIHNIQTDAHTDRHTEY